MYCQTSGFRLVTIGKMNLKWFVLTAIFVWFDRGRASAQETFPRFELEGLVTPNDTFCYSISNSNSWPVRFFPKVVNIPNGEYVTFSEDSLFAWLTSRLTGEGSLVELEMVESIGYLIKSPRHVNMLGLYDHVNGVGHKKFSTIGWFSQYHAQCGDYMRFADNLLVKAYGVPVSRLRGVATPRHTMGEININGSWLKLDFDPNTPSLLTPNTNSSSGYASVIDIVENGQLLDEDNRYMYADSIDLCPWASMIELSESFIQDLEYFDSNVDTGLDIKGHWVLCDGCRLDLNVPISDYRAYLNPSAFEVQAGYQLWVAFQTSGDSSYYWQCIQMLSDYLQISIEETQFLMNSGLVSNQEADLGRYLQDYYERTVPKLTLTIPASEETRIIGSNADIHFPFIVTDVTTSGSLSLSDTSIGSLGFHVSLWNDDSTGVAAAYPALNSELNFLTAGWLHSPYGETVIKMAFNPGVYPIGVQEIDIDMLGSADYLTVDAQVCHRIEDVVTQVDLVKADDDAADMVISPNPTMGKFSVSLNGTTCEDYHVFDFVGNEVRRESLVSGIYSVRVRLADSVASKLLIVN